MIAAFKLIVAKNFNDKRMDEFVPLLLAIEVDSLTILRTLWVALGMDEYDDEYDPGTMSEDQLIERLELHGWEWTTRDIEMSAPWNAESGIEPEEPYDTPKTLYGKPMGS